MRACQRPRGVSPTGFAARSALCFFTAGAVPSGAAQPSFFHGSSNGENHHVQQPTAAACAIHARRLGHSETLRAAADWPRSSSPRVAGPVAGRPRYLSLGKPRLTACSGPLPFPMPIGELVSRVPTRYSGPTGNRYRFVDRAPLCGVVFHHPAGLAAPMSSLFRPSRQSARACRTLEN
jgi:hypothetical protein